MCMMKNSGEKEAKNLEKAVNEIQETARQVATPTHTQS